MKLLEKLRTEALLSQEELADRANLSAGTIRAIEQGAVYVRRPHPRTIRKLCDALAIPYEDGLRLLEDA